MKWKETDSMTRQPSTINDQEEDSVVPVRSALSLLLLLVGATGICVASAGLWGPWAALLSFSLLLVVAGVAIGWVN